MSLSLEALSLDLQAVVDDLHLSQYGVLASLTACPVAIHSAVDDSEHLTHCILWTPDIALAPDPVISALAPLAQTDWDLYLRARYRVQDNEEEADFRARLTNAAVTPDFFTKARELWRTINITEMLPEVRSKTLVLRRGAPTAATGSVGRYLQRIETLIKGAKAMALSGGGHQIYSDNMEEVAGILESFLDDEDMEQRRADPENLDWLGEPPFALSVREREILSFLVRGLRSKEIAYKLGITLNTVERHIATIYRKTGTHGRAAIVAFALTQRNSTSAPVSH